MSVGNLSIDVGLTLLSTGVVIPDYPLEEPQQTRITSLGMVNGAVAGVLTPLVIAVGILLAGNGPAVPLALAVAVFGPIVGLVIGAVVGLVIGAILGRLRLERVGPGVGAIITTSIYAYLVRVWIYWPNLQTQDWVVVCLPGVAIAALGWRYGSRFASDSAVARQRPSTAEINQFQRT